MFQRNLYSVSAQARHGAEQQGKEDGADGDRDGVQIIEADGAVAEHLHITYGIKVLRQRRLQRRVEDGALCLEGVHHHQHDGEQRQQRVEPQYGVNGEGRGGLRIRSCTGACGAG